MSDSTLGTPSMLGRFFSHLFRMPGWYQAVLGLAAALLGAGGVGQVANHFKGSSSNSTLQSSTSSPGSARSVVSGTSTGSDTTAHEPTLVEKIAPEALRIGVSVLAAFIVGWLFRSFIKMMALLTLVVGGGFALLSYFKVINVDLSSAQGQYENAMHWLSDQAGRIKEMVVQYLPSNVGKVLGFYLGFRRHD